MSLCRDDLMIQRYVDGELSDADAAAFAARMLREPLLRERVEELQRFAGAFAAAPGDLRAPAGFTAGVLDEVRRLPAREELEQLDLTTGAVKLCVRVLLAAALVLGLGLAWHAGLLDGNRADTVEAAPDAIEQEMDRLDQLILESMEEPRRGK
ncbi:MAG: hypothetical protein KAI24_25480 [Planctomycetes bacterium]|nr:hypothetical protein [Planctomycetota bacterium]